MQDVDQINGWSVDDIMKEPDPAKVPLVEALAGEVNPDEYIGKREIDIIVSQAAQDKVKCKTEDGRGFDMDGEL